MSTATIWQDNHTPAAGIAGEQWRLVPGTPNYEVSDFGRVRRITGGRGVRAGRILKPGKHPGGYQVVSLWTDGICRKRTIHTLVYEAFIGPRPEGMEVNHLDGVKTNNALSNLEGCTRAENQRHAVSHGLAAMGERHHNFAITDETVAAIRAAAPGRSQRHLARQFGVAQSTVGDILAGRGRFGEAP